MAPSCTLSIFNLHLKGAGVEGPLLAITLKDVIMSTTFDQKHCTK